MDCPSRPVITQTHVEWAYDFVMRHNNLVYSSVRDGLLANTGESDMLTALREIMMSFFTYGGKLEAYHQKAKQMQQNGHIPWGYIQRVATRRACFKPTQWKSLHSLYVKHWKSLNAQVLCGS